MEKKKWYPEVDCLKGIAIFLVVLGHGVILYPVNLHNVAYTSRIYEWVESVHMPLFYLVSGFTFSFGRGYFGKKVRRILIPYLVFCSLDLAARLLFPALVNREKSLGESLYDIVFGGGGYWFIYVLFLLYVLAPLLKLILEKLPILKLPFFVLAFCLPLIPNIPEIFLLRLTAHYFPYFYLGWRIRENRERFKGERLTRLQNLTLAFVFLFFWAMLKELNGTATQSALFIPMALCGCAFFYFLARSPLPGLMEKHLISWGQSSLQIYLLNSYLLVISRTLICRFCGENEAWLILLFNLVFVLGGAMLIIRHVIKRSKILRFLFGDTN